MSDFLEKNIIEEIEWYKSSEVISVNQHDMDDTNRVISSLLEKTNLGRYTLLLMQKL